MEVNKACCPNPDCLYHNRENLGTGSRWYENHGFFNSQKNGKIQRYQCKKCLKCFKLEYRDRSDRKLKPYNSEDVYKFWKNEGCTIRSLAEKYNIPYNMLYIDMYSLVERDANLERTYKRKSGNK